MVSIFGIAPLTKQNKNYSFIPAPDRGTQYRTGVYFHTANQEEIAKARFSEVQKQYKSPIASELKPAAPFWPAEKYHQQYLEKGGQMGNPQDASKGATAEIRCYG